jgi:hypothetical protein
MQSGRAFAAAMSCLLAIGSAAIAGEAKPGGVFRIYHRDSPGSASIHEGATKLRPASTNAVFCGHFSRADISEFRSPFGDIVFRSLSGRLSPAAKIPFQTRRGTKVRAAVTELLI